MFLAHLKAAVREFFKLMGFVALVAVFFLGLMLVLAACFVEPSAVTFVNLGAHGTVLMVGLCLMLLPGSMLAKHVADRYQNNIQPDENEENNSNKINNLHGLKLGPEPPVRTE